MQSKSLNREILEDRQCRGAATGCFDFGRLPHNVRFTLPRLMSRRKSSTPPTPKAAKIIVPIIQRQTIDLGFAFLGLR